jgi:hypothetical protein
MAEQRQGEQRQEDVGKQLKERSMQEFAERTKGKPTPTQEELDRANMGEHVMEKEPDGGAPDPGGQPGGIPEEMSKRQPPPGQPQTRQTGPQPPSGQPQQRPPQRTSE